MMGRKLNEEGISAAIGELDGKIAELKTLIYKLTHGERQCEMRINTLASGKAEQRADLNERVTQ